MIQHFNTRGHSSMMSNGDAVIMSDGGTNRKKSPALKDSEVDNVYDVGLDAHLANALNRMSFQEREVLYEEIHGVSSAVIETEQLVSDSLAAMERELQFRRHKPAYDLAVEKAKDYVTCRKFRLMFLRAQRFNPGKAAEHLVRYMEHLVRYMEGKRERFGDQVLVRPLRLSDLDEEDEACLRSGFMQLFPKRDSRGRTIFGGFTYLTPNEIFKNSRSVIRAGAYLMSTPIESDEEAQKKGVVLVVYCTGGRPPQHDAEFFTLNRSLLHWVPWRVEAIHICNDDSYISKKFFSFVIPTLAEYFQVRVRFHYGSHTECQYSLLSYGIPVENVMPVSYDGELKLTSHTKWITRQKVRERSLQDLGYFEGIELPANNDVLVGRGKTLQTHPGNIHMRSLALAFMEEWEKSSRGGKGDLSAKIVSEIKVSRHGRFLKQESNGFWFEISDDDAKHRVSRSFRTFTECDEQKAPKFKKASNDGKRTRI